MNKEKTMFTDGGYDYLSVTVKKDKKQLYSDCYRNFGWIPVGGKEEGRGKYILKFRRKAEDGANRELAALQERCENALCLINSLEREKTILSIAGAVITGLAAVFAFAGAVAGFMASNLTLFLIFGALSMLGGTVPYYIYNDMRRCKNKKINPIVKKQYEIIFKSCEEAGRLAHIQG